MLPSLLIRSLLTRKLVCLLCGGTRVRRSARVYRGLAATLFVAGRCQECGRRFPLLRRLGSTQVILESGIPTTHPNKKTVEAALQDALGDVPGTWSVDVRAAPQGERWLVSLCRSGRRLRLLLDSREAQWEVVYDDVRHALREAGFIG